MAHRGPLFVVGDVHGCAAELQALLDRMPLTSDATVVFVGDYVDRGPDAQAVLDIILELSTRCHVVPLLGNHESMFLRFLDDPTSPEAAMFIYNGGSTTLASYGDESGDYQLPEEHLRFLRSLELSYESSDHFFVHAGLPEIPLGRLDAAQHRQELLWSRQIIRSEYRWEKTVVHGHTRCRRIQICPNHINVDTGCVYNNRLSALELRSGSVYSVPRFQRGPTRRLRALGSRRAAVRFHGVTEVKLVLGPEVVRTETVNYSDLGMLLRVDPERGIPAMNVGQVISGNIGPDGPAMISFTGQIVRRVEGLDGLYYGVKILEKSEND